MCGGEWGRGRRSMSLGFSLFWFCVLFDFGRKTGDRGWELSKSAPFALQRSPSVV